MKCGSPWVKNSSITTKSHRIRDRWDQFHGGQRAGSSNEVKPRRKALTPVLCRSGDEAPVQHPKGTSPGACGLRGAMTWLLDYMSSPGIRLWSSWANFFGNCRCDQSRDALVRIAASGRKTDHHSLAATRYDSDEGGRGDHPASRPAGHVSYAT